MATANTSQSVNHTAARTSMSKMVTFDGHGSVNIYNKYVEATKRVENTIVNKTLSVLIQTMTSKCCAGMHLSANDKSV